MHSCVKLSLSPSLATIAKQEASAPTSTLLLPVSLSTLSISRPLTLLAKRTKRHSRDRQKPGGATKRAQNGRRIPYVSYYYSVSISSDTIQCIFNSILSCNQFCSITENKYLCCGFIYGIIK